MSDALARLSAALTHRDRLERYVRRRRHSGGLVWAGSGYDYLSMPSVQDLELTRLRAMTATEKVASMHALWRQAWSLTSAGVRARHPDWSPDQVEAEVREMFRRDPP